MVTAVILSHNDEAILPRAIQSVLWCDQILVIDDFSKDKGAQVAKKLGAVVYKRHLHDDFAAQRNFGLGKARGEWVLFIDSDEMVSTDLRDEIQNTVLQGTFDGYFVRRVDYLFGRKLTFGETANVRLLRLGKRRLGIWRRPVHEVWEIPGPTAILRHPVRHFPHPTVAQFVTDINTYSSSNAKYLYTQRVRSNFVHIILYPVGKFFVNYIWAKGFLDGTPGAIIALMMSFHSFLTRAKLFLLWRRRGS